MLREWIYGYQIYWFSVNNSQKRVAVLLSKLRLSTGFSKVVNINLWGLMGLSKVLINVLGVNKDLRLKRLLINKTWFHPNINALANVYQTHPSH